VRRGDNALGRFAFGWCRSGSFSAAGRDAGPVDLGFLGPRPFRSERPALVGWILLDFLGFSRPNLDFSMGYADFCRKNISRAFSVAIAAPEREPAVEAMRKRRIIHGASLTWFLIICNRLSSAPFPSGPTPLALVGRTSLHGPLQPDAVAPCEGSSIFVAAVGISATRGQPTRSLTLPAQAGQAKSAPMIRGRASRV
jgi:hypothetical protein